MSKAISCEITFAVNTTPAFIWEEIERQTEERAVLTIVRRSRDREWLINDVTALFTDESVYLRFIESDPVEVIDSDEYLTFCVEQALEDRLY